MKSILDKLSEERIFYVDVNEGGETVRFMEGCDGYFKVDLTLPELEVLILELTAIASSMVKQNINID